MPRTRFCLVFVFALATNSGFAQEPDAPDKRAHSVSLSALLSELKEKNPEVQGARYHFDAATKRPSQVGTLPDPKLAVTNFGVGHPFSRLNDSNFAYQGIGITQEFPFPGKLALASEEAKKEAQSDREMYEATLRDVTARLKIAYFEWASITKQIEITEKDRAVLERFEELARARYSVGKGIQPDVLKAQVELSTLLQELEVLRERRASAEAQIQFLLGRDAAEPLGTPEELKRSVVNADLDTLLSSLNENSPRIRAQQFLIDSRAVGVERSKKEYRPDFAVNLQWQHTGSNFPDFYMASVEVKLPLYFWRKQRYGAEEAQARLGEARSNYLSTRQEIVFMVKDQYLAAKSSERILSLYESGTIPQANLALESTTSAYEVGKVDFLSLLNGLMSVLTLEKQFYQELARHEQALARLEPFVGLELTQNNGGGK